MRLFIPTVRSLSEVNPASSASFSPTILPVRKHSNQASRLIRTRSGSAHAVFHTPPSQPGEQLQRQIDTSIASSWIGIPCRFEVNQQTLILEGYQLYAVEKWVVERTRPVTVLTVYTGDPQHKITVTALSPSSSLTSAEMQVEWNTALHYLRRDGARPKQVSDGVLMVTSLANFRSDFTIVHVPNGDFLAAKGQLFTNINLSRMGCSGRSALTLEEPSETTKDRFKTTYFLNNSSPTPSTLRAQSLSRSHTRAYSQPIITLTPAIPELSRLSATHTPVKLPSRQIAFNTIVLELVKLLQSALAICGMFSFACTDGLLCDKTVEGLQRWIAEIGEPVLNIEPMERVADPSTVTALLSFVLAARNRLSSTALSQTVPKDPFLYPSAFLTALAAFSQPHHGSSPHYIVNNTTFLPQHSASLSNPPSPVPLHVSTATPPPPGSPTSSQTTFLTQQLYVQISQPHDTKLRHSDSRRVHRALLSKLDPSSDTDTGGSESDIGHGLQPRRRKGIGGAGGQIISGIENLASGFVGRGATSVGASGLLSPTADLGTLVRTIGGKGERDERAHERDKERDKADAEDGERVAGSLRALWTGKVELLVKLRERAVAREHGTEKGRKFKEGKDRDRRASSDVEDEHSHERIDGSRSADDDLAFGGVFAGKVQKKLEMWAGINRSKRSVDLSTSMSSGRPLLRNGHRLHVGQVSTQSSSSGNAIAALNHAGSISQRPPAVSQEIADEDELLSSGQVSPISVSRALNPFTLDLESANASSANVSSLLRDGNGSTSEYDKRVNAFLLSRPLYNKEKRIPSWSDSVSAHHGQGTSRLQGRHQTTLDPAPVIGPGDQMTNKRIRRDTIKRRHSFHDFESLRNIKVLRAEWMRIDVDVCGQLLVMHRRKEHYDRVTACLEYLTSSLSATNATLHADYQSHRAFIHALEKQSDILKQIDVENVTADTTMQQVQALAYEANQFRVNELWHTATPARQKVLELREKVFGMNTGTRRLPHGTHGAHGRFNRLQWTLDGQERLVDAWGRTESEYEEEIRAGAGILGPEEEEEEEPVEHTAMKPMWLLRFFNWGMSWTSASTADSKASKGQEGITTYDQNGTPKEAQPTT